MRWWPFTYVTQNKKPVNEIRKASAAPKEAKKPAAVQKGPEKAQKPNLVDSSARGYLISVGLISRQPFNCTKKN